MKIPQPVTVDFETFGIEGRPVYPPVPVSVSIKYWKKQPKFYAWGHPTGNNCTFVEARVAVAKAFTHAGGVLFHNGKFDVDVAETHLGIQLPQFDQIHDTMFLLFLDDPHQRELGLKPSAERLLGMMPDERDAVADWLVKHQPVDGIKIGKGKTSKHPPGKYIAYAPGDVVGPYANGDVVRTEQLFELLYEKTAARKMLAAYRREQELMLILLHMERQGLRVDVDRLRSDIGLYEGWLGKIDHWLYKQLGTVINLDSSDELAAALIASGKADPALMGVTATGKVATNKASLAEGVTDKVVAGVLKYRTQLQTCLRTFMTVWLAMAEASGGFIYTNWNQVRAEKGTRTGRLSSNPNFQNIPKEFEPIFGDGKLLPKCPWKDLPPLPMCRGYLIPYVQGHLLAGRDYSQQEPRILAHFEDGELKDQYLANPWIDYHDNAKEKLEEKFHREFKRKPVKNINLGIIYGQGAASLALKNGESIEDTKAVRKAIFNLYPGLEDLYSDMKALAKADQPLRTWGGREYYCEPPRMIDGRMVTFDYKMVNVLIQGSAADCTKEAMIRFYRAMVKRKKLGVWFLLLQVHDELLISVPAEEFIEAMEVLRECMESVEFDVPILSEGAWSPDNWAAMKDYDKKGKLVDAF